ncbi:hypothetical protein [Mycobacterium sp.]|uniref:hypothetical protein n=1 Tax=Mycobacterium sp. TaxID=1785 RepID=UPI002C1C8699|nr:hypothetical protein [Mycobacterium sp.]HME48900.1 hypothetical protein [Mycobacterium sp.]
MKFKRIAAGAALTGGLALAAIGLGAGAACADPWVPGPPGPWHDGPGWHGYAPVDDWHGRWHNAPWGDGAPPWGWGAPPPVAWNGPLPAPWGPPPPPINYWGYNVQPVWDPGYNQWGFYLGGVWIPL